MRRAQRPPPRRREAREPRQSSVAACAHCRMFEAALCNVWWTRTSNAREGRCCKLRNMRWAFVGILAGLVACHSSGSKPLGPTAGAGGAAMVGAGGVAMAGGDAGQSGGSATSGPAGGGGAAGSPGVAGAAGGGSMGTGTGGAGDGGTCTPMLNQRCAASTECCDGECCAGWRRLRRRVLLRAFGREVRAGATVLRGHLRRERHVLPAGGARLHRRRRMLRRTDLHQRALCKRGRRHLQSPGRLVHHRKRVLRPVLCQRPVLRGLRGPQVLHDERQHLRIVGRVL